MDLSKFNDEQKDAVFRKGNILVSAGAGSGKTTVLSARVVSFILNEKYKITDFLILTFTELAAKNMKTKIRADLLKEGLEDANFVEQAQISTLDAFTNMLVKKYHNYLNIDADFSIIDKALLNIKRKEFLNEILEKLYKDNDEKLGKIIDKICPYAKNDGEIRKLVFQYLNYLNGQIDKEKCFNEFEERYYSEKAYESYFDIAYKIMIDYQKYLVNILDNDVEDFEIDGKLYYGELKDYLRTHPNDYDSAILFWEHLPTLPQLRAKKYDDVRDELTLSKKIVTEAIKETKTPIHLLLSKNEMIIPLEKNKEISLFLKDLAKQVESKVNDYKKVNNVYTFDDISSFAIALVRDNLDVREAVKNSYKMIMIDEYQDTSPKQEELISYIQNNNVYQVGDIKQAIYKFRGADCEIFKNKFGKYSTTSEGDVILLNKNYRSTDKVLDNINLIFKNIMTLDCGGADYENDHMIEFGQKGYIVPGNTFNYNIDNIVYSKANLDIDSSEKEIRIIAKDIINKINNHYKIPVLRDNDSTILKDVEFKDFAIITRKTDNYEKWVKILNKEYKIPIYMQKNEDITDTHIFNVLKSILRLMKHIQNQNFNNEFDHAVISLQRSFVYETSDTDIYLMKKNNTFLESEAYLEIKEVLDLYKNRTSISKFIKVIEKLDVYHKLVLCGDYSRNCVYIDSLINSLKALENLDFNIDQIVEYIDQKIENEEKFEVPAVGNSSNSVTLINTHKSKGLEYNIVYFPQLNRQFNYKSFDSNNFIDKCGYYFKNEEIKKFNIFEYKKEIISEEIRLFYVALTRAKIKMIMVMEDGEKYKRKIMPKSHFDLYYPYSHNFNTIKEEDIKEEELKIKNNNKNESDKAEIEIEDYTLEYTIKEDLRKASKELNLGVDKSKLTLGTNLHLLLEIIDFNKPDYSIIKNEFYKQKIKQFIDSDLMKNIKDASIYKEYQYIDEEDNSNGIIDLLIVKKDEALIIDYKTKNIADEHYDEQLKTYQRYILKKYPDKQVKMYLYSIIDGTVREVK